MILGTEFENLTLDEIVNTAQPGGIFNNAAQVWNHTFYWHCLSPNGGGEPTGKVLDAIVNSFGSFADFKEQFTNSAITNFGSGWTWLVQNKDGSVEILNTSNAGCALTSGKTPLLTIDVWEHAYYVDYRNARPAYIDAFWNLVNWDFVSDNLD
jgi:Fe-Mn family superoxide dismutase